MVIWLLFLCISANPSVNNGGTTSIFGTVTDSYDNPLIGATVLVIGTSYGAMTDHNGSFTISNLPPGTYSVQACMVGMSDKTAEGISVEINTATPVFFTLDRYGVSADELPILIKI